MNSASEANPGWFEGQTHVFPLRVYYEDTDFSGVVYHASYLRFMERGRSEFLRLIGLRHRGLLKAEEPLVWVVRRLTVEYFKPARAEDGLWVRTRFLAVEGARLHLEQVILRQPASTDDAATQVLTKAEVEVCVVTLDGKPRRVPPNMREKLNSFLVS